MGKHHRESLRKQQESRRNKRIVKSAAALILGITGSFAGAKLLGSEEKSIEKMPSEVAALVDNVVVSGGDAKVKNVEKENYHEAATIELSNNTVKIAEIGSQPAGNYDKLIQMYKMLDGFINGNPSDSVHDVTVYDSNDLIVGNLKVNAQLKPLNKDITVLSVPYDVDIGGYDGAANVFTDTRGEEAVSFIHPGGTNELEGAFTEACQGMVNVQLTSPDQFKESKDKVQLLLQEQVCNSLAKAAIAQLKGDTFSMYSARQTANSRQMFTDQFVQPGNVGYVSMMPVLGSEEIYNQLGNNIPADFGANLSFPPVSQQ